jgi:hypothetical protein
MRDAIDWLFAKPNPKWKSATTVMTTAWSIATLYPTAHLYDVMSDSPRPLQTQFAWMYLVAWMVCSTVVFQVFINLTRLWDRVDVLEKELASLRPHLPKDSQ